MTEDRRIAERRQAGEPAEDRPADAAAAEGQPDFKLSECRALVPVVSPAPDSPDTDPRRGGFAGFAAQILGQGGQKRGLRGGPETLNRARSSYLGAEWSGPADRRPSPGRITKTDI